MCSDRFLLTALVVLASLTLVASHPTDNTRRVDLNEAVNKSLCPIEVVIDDDPNRIPQRIKTMKCANETMSPCKTQNLPTHECCLSHGSHRKTCVEMRDTVLVYYKDRKATMTYYVAVGCTCLVEQVKDVASVTDTNTRQHH